MSTESASPTRAYRKRVRAEQEARTRQRITEAAIKLHGTVGPARTTISGVAAEAGVQRATVYRHFPDEESLFMACSAHWASLNPLPDPGSWNRVRDPEERLQLALNELYAWYAWAEPMLANTLRDGALVPAMEPAVERFWQQFAELHASLMAGRRVRGRRRALVAAAISIALDFGTWRSLVRQTGLRPEEAVELMGSLVVAAAGASSR